MEISNSVAEIADIIKNAGSKKVLLATHVSPDGDALGSLVGVGLLVQHFGGDPRALLVSGVPGYLSWLDIPWSYCKKVEDLGSWVPDLLITVDCGDSQRAGSELAKLFGKNKLPATTWKGLETINIDHHLGNPLFGTYNFVNVKKSATSELVAELAESLEYELSGHMAEALYLGISTDTGNFTYTSTTAGCHKVVATLIENGLDIAQMTKRLENNWSIEKMHLWGYLMSKMKTHHAGSIAGIIVTNSVLKKFNATKEDLEGFAGWMRRLIGIKATLFVREESSKQCKISLRSMGDVDVRSVAAFFGGGGHEAAAGAMVGGKADLVYERVLDKLMDAVGLIK